eukprot:8327651-Lingulodinium_polyedra.AAC.1
MVLERIREWKSEGTASVRRTGGAFYRTMWRLRRGPQLESWLASIAKGRRWLTDHGAEWRLLEGCHDAN